MAAFRSTPARPGPRQGGLTEPLLESRVPQFQKADQVGSIEIGPRSEGRVVFEGRLRIPGANILADITAEEPFTDAVTQIRRESVLRVRS